MQYERQKEACAEYAQRNGGSVADVLRVSGRKGAVVLSKDGRTIFDPFVIEPIGEIIPNEPVHETEKVVKEEVEEEANLDIRSQSAKKKSPARKKK